MVPPNAESFLSALKSLQRSRMVWKYIQTLVLGCSDHYCDDSLRRPVLCSHLLMQILEGLPNLQNLNILYARFIHKTQAPYSIKRSVKSLLKRPQDSPSGSSYASAERCIFNPKHSSSNSKHATVTPRPTFSLPLKQFNLTATGSLEDPSFAFQEILALFSSFESSTGLFVDFDFLHNTRPAEESFHIQLTGAQKTLWDLLPRFECLKAVFSDPTTSSPQSLAALRIRCPSVVHFEYLAHFLPDIDPELQHFDIDPSTMYKDVVDIVDWTKLNLARFTRMKTLSFTIDYASLVDYDVSKGRLLLLCHFPAAFLATASRDITRISIRLCVRVRNIEAFNVFMDWETLEDELLKFPNLVRVKFKRITSWGKDDDYEDLASLEKIGLPMKLPRLQQSGLLSLVETPILPYINVY
ncbi:hypothetical protein C8Q75DRAFT_167447 [Abortiporus biennis]|nr:hypothetical protein C8Q75DRAFT_167447 [Abortiporus biennis]